MTLDSTKINKAPMSSPLAQQAMEEIKSYVDALTTLVNDIRAKLVGNYLLTVPTLSTGSTAQNIATIAFDFIIAGKVYKKAAVAAGTAISGDTVPQNKYGAYRLQIGADGTIDAVAATANGTGYTTAALALAGLPAVASGHAAVGTLTVMSTDAGGFIPGTTAISAAAVTEVYADSACAFESIGAAVS